MSEYHFPIPGQELDEKIIIWARRHWASFLKSLLIILFSFFVPIVLLFSFWQFLPDLFSGIGGLLIVLGGSLYYLILWAYAFVEWITYYYDLFIVTDSKIIDVNQDGVFHRQITELSLLRVQDVSGEMKGLLETIFAYGDIVIQTAGAQERSVFPDIPNPYEIAEKVLSLHNQLVEKEARKSELKEGEGRLKGTLQ